MAMIQTSEYSIPNTKKNIIIIINQNITLLNVKLLVLSTANREKKRLEKQ